MSLRDKIASVFSSVARKISPQQGRAFKAAAMNQLGGASWASMPININQDLRLANPMLKGSSRDLLKNNPHFQKFLTMARRNLIGPDGIRLQSKVKDASGASDKAANKIIEDAWADWGKARHCTTEGKLTWLDLQNFAVTNFMTDGEVFLRLLPGYNNKYRFSIQVLESMALSMDLNANLNNGVRIRQGIEIDEWGKPLAYHFIRAPWGRDYSDYTPIFASSLGFQYDRIPASQIVHIYKPEFPGQLRGRPVASSVIWTLKMLDGYTEAELTAARAEASKMGFYTVEQGADVSADSRLADGTMISEFEPGIIQKLPAGVKYEKNDLQHPNGNYETFRKAILRESASGLGVSYNEFGNDLEGVNYSSIRQGALAERDTWKQEQSYWIEHLCQPVYESWLGCFLLAGLSPLPASKFDKFNSAEWLPRSWGWVDPRADADANISLMKAGLRSPQMILAETGVDIEDLQEQFQAATPFLKMVASLFPDKGTSADSKAKTTVDDDASPDDAENTGDNANGSQDKNPQSPKKLQG